jgi:hypothetical protein
MSQEQAFKQVLIDAGIPTTDEEIQKVWDAILKGQGFEVNNTSPYSPFWRLQKALIGKPALQFIDVLTKKIMPNTFVLSSSDQWLEQHGASRNTPRLPALKAQGNVQISRVDSTGVLVIPAATLIQSSPINGIVYQLKTLFDTTFNDGEAVQIALTEALIDGSDHNLTGGYYNSFVVPVEGVSVLNGDDWLVQSGQNIESDDNYKLRQRDIFATLGDFHVDAVYRSIISKFPGILVDNIFFEHTAPRGPASANAYVFLSVGAISQAVIDEINNHIASGYHGHGDDLLLFAMPTQNQAIVMDYWLTPNANDIKTELEQFIRAAFRENSAYKPTKCKPNSTFSFSLLSAELHNQFPTLKTLKFTNNDIATALWLPVIETLTVTAV